MAEQPVRYPVGHRAVAAKQLVQGFPVTGQSANHDLVVAGDDEGGSYSHGAWGAPYRDGPEPILILILAGPDKGEQQKCNAPITHCQTIVKYRGKRRIPSGRE